MKAVSSIVLLLFVVYCMGSTGIISVNNTPESRVSFTCEELDAFDHIYSYVPYGSTIRSDYYTSRYFIQENFSKSDDLGIPFYQSQIIQNVTDIPSYQGLVIIPHTQFMKSGLRFSRGSGLNPEGGMYPYLPSNETVSALSRNLFEKNKIYSSECIELYHS